jgi:hypothetical protein
VIFQLTAERDRLRAENATLRAAQKACEACDVPTAFEVRQLRADCENETKWAAHYLAQSIADKSRAERAEANETVALANWNGALERALKAEAELATEREKSERYRLATLKLDAELAAERARLDWLESDAGVDWQWSSSALTIRRAVIDAAMKEDAK